MVVIQKEGGSSYVWRSRREKKRKRKKERDIWEEIAVQFIIILKRKK